MTTATTPVLAAPDFVRDPRFIRGIEHISEAETEKGQRMRCTSLAGTLHVTNVDVIHGQEVLLTLRRSMRDVPTGYYRLTRDIENPFHDGRSTSRYLASFKVIPRDTMFRYYAGTPRNDYDFPEIEFFGLGTSYNAKAHDRNFILMILLNAEAAPVMSLCEAMRADAIEDHDMLGVVMRLLDQGRVSLDEIRGLVRASKATTEEEDTALDTRHGFKR